MFLNQSGVSKKMTQKFINNIICNIISHKFYIATFRMPYFSLVSLEEITLIAIDTWTFHVPDLLKINHYISQIGFNFVRLVLYWHVFIFITVTFIFNIIVVPKITYSYWFTIIIFLFKKDLIISNHLSFMTSFYFFTLKRFLMHLII